MRKMGDGEQHVSDTYERQGTHMESEGVEMGSIAESI